MESVKKLTFLSKGKQEKEIEVSHKFLCEFEAFEENLEPLIQKKGTQVNLSRVTSLDCETKFVNFVENYMRKIM